AVPDDATRGPPSDDDASGPRAAGASARTAGRAGGLGDPGPRGLARSGPASERRVAAAQLGRAGAPRPRGEILHGLRRAARGPRRWEAHLRPMWRGVLITGNPGATARPAGPWRNTPPRGWPRPAT